MELRPAGVRRRPTLAHAATGRGGAWRRLGPDGGSPALHPPSRQRQQVLPPQAARASGGVGLCSAPDGCADRPLVHREPSQRHQLSHHPPQQIIQPWQFGHGEVKATCLWLKNMPKLKPTQVVDGREAKVYLMPPGPDRWKNRSRTYEGVAAAMGQQWGNAALPAAVDQLGLCLSLH